MTLPPRIAAPDRPGSCARVAFLPIAGPRNPYQRLQIEGLRRAGIDARHGAPGRWFAATRTQLRMRPSYLHYDWNYPYFLRRPRWLSGLMALAYRMDVALARRLGARFVWTLHNVRTHEPLHHPVQRRVQRWFARQCEWIRVFDESTIAKAARYLDVDPARFRVVPHGSYLGEYADDIGRAEARRRLDLPAAAFVLLSLGELRPYKGLPALIRLARRSADPELRVLVAGRPSIPAVGEELRALAAGDSRILVRTEFIPPDEIQLYARAADAMVLPFESIDNSGSAILAMGFELPVVAPRQGGLPGLLAGQPELLFEPGELEGALQSVRRIGERRRREIGRRNREVIEGRRWEALAPLFTSAGAGDRVDSRPRETALAPRRAAMAGAVRLLEWSGITTAVARRRHRTGGVVTYHNVIPSEWIAPGFPYTVDHGIEMFERQLDILADRYGFLPAGAATTASGGVVLSFDDGMRNNIEVIAPILAERGITAVFAIVAGGASGELPHLWRDHLYLMLLERAGCPTRLPDDSFAAVRVPTPATAPALVDRVHQWVQRERIADVQPILRETFARNDTAFAPSEYRSLRFRPMREDAVRDLRRAGHVIASHTWSHPVLSRLDERSRREELGRSREWLEGLLGEPVRWLVYPFGGPAAVDGDSVVAARAAGYRHAWMNIDTAGADPMLLPRFSMPRSASVAELTATVSGLRSAWRHRGAGFARAAL